MIPGYHVRFCTRPSLPDGTGRAGERSELNLLGMSGQTGRQSGQARPQKTAIILLLWVEEELAATQAKIPRQANLLQGEENSTEYVSHHTLSRQLHHAPRTWR